MTLTGPARLALGTCPDSWGVWFADDPRQTPWQRFLDDVAEVGYEWLELGKMILEEYGVRPQFHPHADSEAIICGYPGRIGYVHIKQMDPAIVEIADRDGLAFGQAVAMGASCEPPRGEPDIGSVTDALRDLGTHLFVVVEQDMYPVDFDRPKPIAQRTSRYLRSVGIGGSAGSGGERP
jgi:sugar phosphate isomerase/epimerase